jgi:hypothetical protein
MFLAGAMLLSAPFAFLAWLPPLLGRPWLLTHELIAREPEHLEALRQHGPTPLHRHSFMPVRESGCWAAGAVQEDLPLEIWPPRS